MESQKLNNLGVTVVLRSLQYFAFLHDLTAGFSRNFTYYSSMGGERLFRIFYVICIHDDTHSRMVEKQVWNFLYTYLHILHYFDLNSALNLTEV